MPLGALQHYTIEPSNLARTKKFYCEVLGLKNGDRPPLDLPPSDGIGGGLDDYGGLSSDEELLYEENE